MCDFRASQAKRRPAAATRPMLAGSGTGAGVRKELGDGLVNPRISKVTDAGGSMRTPVKNTPPVNPSFT